MPRSIDLTARSPHSLQRIRSAFQDEAYFRARVDAFDAGSPTIDHLTIDPSGQTALSVTMRFTRDQLPEPLQWLRVPVLTVVQCERWSVADDGSVHGEITVDASRTPISGRGAVRLVQADSGTRLAGTATVKVNVPLVGGPISNVIVGLLATAIVDIVRVTDTWLDANP